MRKQLVQTVENLMSTDERLVVLLGDIGVFGFRNAFSQFPDRIYNVGICEQAMMSLGAGMAKEGLIPVLHSIAPFIVERCFEQIKVDFCYQQLGGNIVSVGASYDYAALGCTHHGPSDVAILHSLPGMEIIAPGTPSEFDLLFRAAYANGHPTYFRLSERSNPQAHSVQFGRATVIRCGGRETIIAVGPTLASVLEATHDLDVTILYYTTIAPFDVETLQTHCENARVILVEPYSSGVLVPEIHKALGCTVPVMVDAIGVPRQFLTNYGTAEDHDAAIGMTAAAIRGRVCRLMDAKPLHE